MDIAEIRRENLRRLMNEMFEGKQSKIADALEKSPNYISRCLSLTMAAEHRKKIGEDFAREIEEKLRQPRYSLDSPFRALNPGETSPEVERNPPGAQADGPEFKGVMSSLMKLKGRATPRSLDVLKRIEQAVLDGRIKEEDLVALEGIAKRFEKLNSETP